MKHVVILGGNGFVGSGIARYCARAGIEHQVVGRDDYDAARQAPCEVLINANGSSKRYVADKEPLVDFDASVRSVLKSILDFRFERYVHVSSVAVYSDATHPDHSRESMLPDPELQTHYGLHRTLAESLVRHYCPRWLIVRLGGVIGDGLKKNQVFDILNDRPLRVGARSRYQFVDTEEVGEKIFAFLEGQTRNDTFNLCGTGTTSLEQIQRALGKQPGPFEPEDEIWSVNNDKANAVARITPTRVALERSLSRVLGRQVTIAPD